MILQQTQHPGTALSGVLDITLCNLLLGHTDNHAKNHALLHTGQHPELAPAQDIFPTLIDPQVTHQMTFDTCTAMMNDDITPADLQAFIGDVGIPQMAPALRRRMQGLILNRP